MSKSASTTQAAEPHMAHTNPPGNKKKMSLLEFFKDDSKYRIQHEEDKRKKAKKANGKGTRYEENNEEMKRDGYKGHQGP